MKRVMVTGGTGFIGAYVLRRLLDAPDRPHVRVLARRPERLPAETRARVEIVEGDILDRAAIRAAVRDADLVLHLAALARAWAPDARIFQATNADAVRTLLDEAARADVGRVVHVSSVVAGGPHASNGRPAGHGGGSPYEASKRESEELVLRYASEGGRAVIVRPTRVYGPGPLHDANGVTKMLAHFLDGRFRIRLDDRDVLANYVHADDVAQGIILAAERVTRDPVYVLGGENTSLREFLALAGDLAGVRRRVIPIPPWAGYALAGAAEVGGRLGVTPFITRAWVRAFLEDWRVDIEPARRDLGYRPRSLRAGLKETIRWLREENLESAA